MSIKSKLKKQLASLKQPSSNQEKKKEIIENSKKIYEILIDDNVSIDKKYNAINTLINHIKYDKVKEELEIYYS